ncbi:MAG TPA: S8 family serine peptidase [Blastocatellia bacterium]|nr:S8 family serine peptidase [Blastocatellia bacterium]
MSSQAMAQIQAIMNEKGTRTGAQQKMDSQLIYALKMQRGEMIAEGVRTLETNIKYNSQRKMILNLKARVSDALLNQLKSYGADIVSSFPRYNSIRIQAVIGQVEAIAALPDVLYVQPEQGAMTSRVDRAPKASPQTAGRHDRSHGFASRAARVRNLVSAALLNRTSVNAGMVVGSRNTEGDVTHRAFSARSIFNIDGTGIKIGVLSDGVTNLAASQASGDVGPVTVLPGQAGSGDEGTAMLEIIQDIVPGAQLFFATAFGGIVRFAQNIRDLRAAGCDIIVDDVFYFVETPFQDGQATGVASNTNGGVVIQAVNDVTASGALFFSSAGNSGNLNDGTSGVWEGNFVNGGPTGAPLPSGSIHDFGGQNFDALTASSFVINLYWSDSLGGSVNDYDLFLLNADGTAVITSSTNIQNGTQDPYEQISRNQDQGELPFPAGSRIVIVKKAGAADRFLHLNTNRGRLSIATAGQTHGHAAAANAFGCAATPAATAIGGALNPTGPFPNPFSSSNVVERFSSDGPRRVFFQADGTPITPGNFSATGGLLRQKPDITAADGVSVTGVGGFPSRFFGTSAAAPHAAALAGLLKSANPSFTPAQIRAALMGSAIDIEAPGVDRDSGAGIIDVVAALRAIGVPIRTTTVMATGPVQFSDVVTLSSTTIPQVSPATPISGSVEFFVNNISVGSASVNSSGVATINTRILLAAGSYTLRAAFTSSNPDITNSMGTSTLPVSKENAVVTPSASNPTVVKVNSPRGSAGPITLCATVAEETDGNPGDISLATPVNFTLSPVGPGSPITQNGALNGGGIGGTLTACAALNNVPVNVYNVGVSIGGNNFTGSGGGALGVFDPALKAFKGAGNVVRNGRPGTFIFNVKYRRDGTPQGGLFYAERRPTGFVTLQASPMQSLSVVGNTGVIFGRATVNGVANHSFRAIIVDGGKAARNDRFGLQVISPSGAVVADLTFDPIALRSGNIKR